MLKLKYNLSQDKYYELITFTTYLWVSYCGSVFYFYFLHFSHLADTRFLSDLHEQLRLSALLQVTSIDVFFLTLLARGFKPAIFWVLAQRS
jgi:hypothetical protein